VKAIGALLFLLQNLGETRKDNVAVVGVLYRKLAFFQHWVQIEKDFALLISFPDKNLHGNPIPGRFGVEAATGGLRLV